MTIHLNVTSELERQLNKVARQMGLAPDTYIVRLLQRELQKQADPSRLSHEESVLLQQINTSLSAIEWEAYRALIAKRDAGTLSASEQAELIACSDQIEEANARRMDAVANLARARKTSVSALVKSLGIAPIHV
jgi:hypothetical protein